MPDELQRPLTRGELNRRLVANALTKPINVLVPAGIAVVALLIGLWWLIPAVALPAYVALCVVTYLDVEEAERVGRQARGLPSTAGSLGGPRIDPRRMAPPIAAQLQAARDEEARIRTAISAASLPLDEVGGEVDGLVRAMERTAQRAQMLWDYLASQDAERISARIAELRAASAAGGAGAADATQVAEALTQQLAALHELRTQLDRFFSQMEHMTASLGTMHAQILRMSVASESADQRELADQARELREELNAVAQGMSEVYESVPEQI